VVPFGTRRAPHDPRLGSHAQDLQGTDPVGEAGRHHWPGPLCESSLRLNCLMLSNLHFLAPIRSYLATQPPEEPGDDRCCGRCLFHRWGSTEACERARWIPHGESNPPALRGARGRDRRNFRWGVRNGRDYARVSCDETSHKVESSFFVARGLGLVPDLVIDQHFAQRARVERLVGAVAEDPGVLGIGIDEDTAVILEHRMLRITGSGAVYVADGEGVTYTNVSERKPDRTLRLHDLRLHVLSQGSTFDLGTRRPGFVDGTE
jgi:hypothetical protein